jgi:hypothetical protein
MAAKSLNSDISCFVIPTASTLIPKTPSKYLKNYGFSYTYLLVIKFNL